MKRIFKNFLLIGIAAAMFTACGKDSDENELEDDGADGVAVPIENGAIKAKFTISSAGDQAYFSTGNLQYQASTNTWRFAENQYDMIGADNQFISSTYGGWIDLFCYGTSGWPSGAIAYQPYSTSVTESDYYIDGYVLFPLVKGYENLDWGLYNKISNGGNEAGVWRTLTGGEWKFLMQNRPNAKEKMGAANVNGVNGVVILPDDWTLPKGLKFTSGFSSSFESEYYAKVNKYSLEDWRKMEAHGAVFLPASGLRKGTQVKDVGDGGYYWTSSANDKKTRMAFFYSYGLDPYYESVCGIGYSVRLVQDVK